MKKRKKIAVILSGCGVYDGAEIHESVLTMLAIEQQRASYVCFAPDIKQYHVVNHLTGDAMDESRNVLIESARIARGNIRPLSDFDVADFDALMFPGGFGAAKNLSSFAFDGSNCSVNDDVVRVLKAMVALGKPVGALCISPVILSKIFGAIAVTIGSDEKTATAIEAMGSKHVETTHGEVVVDEVHKFVTTPCYMLEATISQIMLGASNVVREVLKLA
jgi:enhancing lycopene biosynthesis protein 2